jgi:hypothetical protein
VIAAPVTTLIWLSIDDILPQIGKGKREKAAEDRNLRGTPRHMPIHKHKART